MVELGADVEADAARATYEDGILRVEIPLAATSAAARARCRSAGAAEELPQ